MRREAQSTSALEGAYAPLSEVLTADEASPVTAEMTEILNYVAMADMGFAWVQEGRPLTLGLIEDLQGHLMRGTPLEHESGRLRTGQVVIGRTGPGAVGSSADPRESLRAGAPGGPAQGWSRSAGRVARSRSRRSHRPHRRRGMAHCQFETLHPFRDGNGRLGRYLIVPVLLTSGVLSEPTLTVSKIMSWGPSGAVVYP